MAFANLSGSCFCGALAYRITKPLVGAQSCHCSRCRKIFSGPGSAFAFLAEGSFAWTSGDAALTHFATKDGWELGFCGVCGSTLCGIHGGVVRGVTLGTIDGDPGVQLDRHIHVASKAPWDHIGGDPPRYDHEPPA